MFRVPRTTLTEHVKAHENNRVIADRPGGKGKVPLDDQAVIVRWAQLRALLRFPVSPTQIRLCAGKIAAERETPFKRGTATRKWYKHVFYPKWQHELDVVKPSKIKAGQVSFTPQSLQVRVVV